ncbi:MAG: ABC transporter substrate-binding protein [Burkholderiaceae bacterium]|nr:ABC transporter substrate-binding protein [Burkholderiaceae bacterium]
MPPSFVHRRRFAAATVLSAATLAAPRLLARSARMERESVSIAVGGRSLLCYLPLTVADQLGFFREEGLDVAIQDFAGGALALQAVQDGRADLCSGAYEHTLRQQMRGREYRAVVLQGRAPQLALGLSVRAMRGFRGLPDMAGRIIGVSAVGSSTQAMASLLLDRAGVDLSCVQFVGVGSDVGALDALRSGQIQALCHADPIMTVLEQKNHIRLVSEIRSLSAAQEVFGGEMPAACLYAPQAFLHRRPAVAQALANGIVHALKWLQTAGPADLVKVVPEAYLLGDRRLYLAAFNRVRETFSTNGLMPAQGPANAQRAMARVDTLLRGRQADLSRTFTNQWANKAQQKFDV